MAEPYEYGDHLTLQALSERFMVEVVVVSAVDGTTQRIVPNEEDSGLPVLYLGYYHENQGTHYVSLDRMVDSAGQKGKYISMKFWTPVREEVL